MHPYKDMPNRSFWSLAVTRNYNALELFSTSAPVVSAGEKIISAGSCFASNLVPYLESHGLTYLRTEVPHPAVSSLPPETFGYSNFSAAYGNIYTARQLLQLFRRAIRQFQPIEDRWLTPEGVIDVFRPGLRHCALSEREFEVLTIQHLDRTLEAFRQADVMIFTFGLTEAWISRQDGAVFPACPGTVRGVFDPQQHEFVNFNVDEITHDFCELIREVAAINSRIRYIITVSPVPLAATATGSHVVTASTYSKAVLRVAVDQIVRRSNGAVVYFPAYEIVVGTQAPHSFFQTDRRNVSATAVEEVMGVFLGFCDCHYSGLACNRNDNRTDQSFVEAFSRRISDAACEEAMVENS